MLNVLLDRTLTREEVERGGLLLTPEVAERIRAHPSPLCARVDDETREIRLVRESGAGGGERWWLDGALPRHAREGERVVAHEGAGDYCIAVVVKGH